jgi:hypothetical protein
MMPSPLISTSTSASVPVLSSSLVLSLSSSRPVRSLAVRIEAPVGLNSLAP